MLPSGSTFLNSRARVDLKQALASKFAKALPPGRRVLFRGVSRTDVPNASFARLRVRERCLASGERRPRGCQAEPVAARARAEIATADGRERPLRVYPRCTSNMHAGRDFTHLSALHSIVTDFREVGGPLD